MGGLGSKIKLPYVHRFKTRHGETIFYFRKKGLRIRLPDEFGTEEFMQAYSVACTLGAPAKMLRGDPGTFNRLISEYQQSRGFKKLKPSTAKVYRNIFAKFAESHGHRIVSQMKSTHVEKIVADMSETPGAANSFLKRFKTIMKFAFTQDWIDRDPTFGQTGYKAGHFHTWEDEEIKQFETYWPIGTKERTAFALHLYTGQRRSDVHRMTWAHYKDDKIKVVQLKTGIALSIPVHPALANLLSQTKKEQFAIIATEHGKPFSVAGYGAWINSAIKKAGLPDRCKAHGLRSAAASRLADCGCTPHEIMSITGHQTLAMVALYTKGANQIRNSEEAMKKQISNTEWQTFEK